jgi:hypothetical protein
VRYKRRVAAQEPDAPTTLSSAARGVDVRPGASWTRRHLLYGAIGIALGGTSGAVLALRSVEAGTPPAPTSPTSAAEAAPGGRPPPPIVTPIAPPAPAAALDARDPHAVLVVQIKELLARFLAWSGAHPDARCPDPATLGASALDPWGHGLHIICSDQPVDQIAGVLSYGPDGTPGTRDDIVSWTLGPEVTDLVRGPRWGSTQRVRGGVRRRPPVAPSPAAAASPQPSHAPTASSHTSPAATAPSRSATPPSVPAQPTSRSAGTGSGSSPPDGEGIPDRR